EDRGGRVKRERGERRGAHSERIARDDRECPRARLETKTCCRRFDGETGERGDAVDSVPGRRAEELDGVTEGVDERKHHGGRRARKGHALRVPDRDAEGRELSACRPVRGLRGERE